MEDGADRRSPVGSRSVQTMELPVVYPKLLEGWFYLANVSFKEPRIIRSVGRPSKIINV